jgi:hypothetical protein
MSDVALEVYIRSSIYESWSEIASDLPGMDQNKFTNLKW